MGNIFNQVNKIVKMEQVDPKKAEEPVVKKEEEKKVEDKASTENGPTDQKADGVGNLIKGMR